MTNNKHLIFNYYYQVLLHNGKNINAEVISIHAYVCIFTIHVIYGNTKNIPFQPFSFTKLYICS